ncbi:MAG: RnfABCDGE type electron transport complex subunit G [Bacteroidales bacterium]|nr:RnfABCDGE type electron transport complex subunit G [Bacteroidales bacterium]
MKKKTSTLINMVISLTLIAGVSAICLGAVYTITKGPIEEAQKAKREAAIKAVLPEFDHIEVHTQTLDGGEITLNKAYKDGEHIGTAIETFTNRGFSGLIRLMVGLLDDGTIYGVSVLEHKETPGLGDKIEPRKSNWFDRTIKGKNPLQTPLKVNKDGGDVDAITAATITTRAYCDAVNRAAQAKTIATEREP